MGRDNKSIGEIAATKEFRENDNKIVECTWDYEKNTWKFMRVRTDKRYLNVFIFGSNHFKTNKKKFFLF